MQVSSNNTESVTAVRRRQNAAPVAALANSTPPILLLVSEDDSFRTNTRAFLEEENFLVRSCPDAARVPALFFSRAAATPESRRGVDLLLIDVDRLGVAGLRLAAMLASFDPGLPVIVLSGPDAEEELLASIRRRRWNFVSKPVAVPELLELIYCALNLARSGPGRNCMPPSEPRPLDLRKQQGAKP